VRISKDDIEFIINELQESLDEIPDGAVIEIDGGAMEQSFKLPPQWINSETGEAIDGTDVPEGPGAWGKDRTGTIVPDRFVQVIILPATQEIFDRVHE
jgi:hypothetical protein